MTECHRGMTRRRVIQGLGCGLALSGFGAPAIATQRELVITSDLNTGQYAVFREIVADFGRRVGVRVTLNNIAHEANKTAIRNYLVADPPDICFWFSGARMRQFVQLGLFADISELVARQNFAKPLGPLLKTVSVNGRQYGLPLGGLFWGLYYRADVFARHDLSPPATFEDFHRTCAAARQAGLIPVSMGTKEQWPAAGWFDHLNLRINGLEKHMALMRGEMAYSDTSLDPVFAHWAEMIHDGFFLKHGTSYAWQQAAAFLAQGKAAMMDLSNFIQGAMPADAVDQLRLIRFPMYNASIGPFEDFASNSIHIPARARHQALAQEFLGYFYQPEVLAKFIAPIGSVPPRSDMSPGDNPLMRTATELLRASQGTSQYYDRDTEPAMARAGLNGFQEFRVYPEREKAIRAELDRVRKRVYAPA
ncbi:ABC transporter substrate-binding protein [Salinisphaera sp. Q1T1-3]|uniref:ABC transporter substrate-binding protein n=1 Tax=Salinisphaera sp. Q1T1-3 TaxID=2321229 RepID=UPI000E71AD6A|nr:ABC transporter substrate-binding protein [Salinisphaera sp. Q1T1-3]RJS93620.1 carbohydrate ABC transporter substrate-binding protein [Salinisphaera sp. Q1T1-3]